MKIAYHFNVHHDPRQFSWLFNAVYNPHDYFSIHIDRRADPETARGFFDIIRGLPNVHATRRISVRWGGWSICQSELISLRDMLRRYSDWSYFTVLSGFDYPPPGTRRNRRVSRAAARCQLHPGRPDRRDGPRDPEPAQAHVLRSGGRSAEFSNPVSAPASVSLAAEGIGLGMSSRGRFPEWLLSDPVARRCRSGHPLRLYSRRDVDAGTPIENSPFLSSWVNDDLREIVWEESPDTPGAHKAHPEILTRNHLGLLETSRAFFARKFDCTIDCDVLHRLARRIGVAPAE